MKTEIHRRGGTILGSRRGRGSNPATTSGRHPRAGGARALGLALLIGASLGCRQDMFNQPKEKTLAESDFFQNGMASRPPVAGTVGRGQLREDAALNSGIGPDGLFIAALPVPLTPALMARGQERFNIYCSPCHSRTGDGRGMIVERGFKAPPPFEDPRLLEEPIGYFFDVMTNGFGQMSGYASQVPVKDRWAIAAYLRALQLARHAPAAELSAADREGLARSGDKPAPAAGGADAHVSGGGGAHEASAAAGEAR